MIVKTSDLEIKVKFKIKFNHNRITAIRLLLVHRTRYWQDHDKNIK